MLAAFLAVVAMAATSKAAKPKTDFNRDIRPILSNYCFRCHGPDSGTREADLRLDREQDAKADRDGHPVVLPGKPDASELLRRILAEDEGERMPPPETGKTLTAKEIAKLKKWIAEGAEWSLPWTYVPPKRHAAPKVPAKEWALNWIDNFVLARLNEEGLSPSPDADKRTLIRRLSIDLTGLPPTPAEVDAFLADKSPDAYERLIDRLLESPHFGERMAIYWLDLVRYADTVGYHGDQEHYISPYRDYVINAFNVNMPFNQFTREQLAGDLLDEPTIDQKIATGYNRVLQTSHEGGVQPKEYIAIYGADRVRNVSNVWMGATMGCAQCHDHKFDPYTMKDFYAMKAFFADIDDTAHLYKGADRSPTQRHPELELLSDEQQIKLSELESRQASLQKQRRALLNEQKKLDAAPKEDEPEDVDDAADDASEDGDAAKTGDPAEPAGEDKKPKNDDEDAAAGASPNSVAKNVGVDKLAANDRNAAAANEVVNRIENRIDRRRSENESSQKKIRRQLQEVERQIVEIHRSARRTMITVALKEPRETRVLPRGNWLDETGEVVEASIPEFMGKLEVGDRRATRLDLANWLTDPKHGSGGLTARVMANRFWYMLFGRGLAAVLDDFGGQGEAPSHPELLDNLAIEFVASGWDVKHMMKLIAMSHAYRQSSRAGAEIRENDPLNVLVSHQGKFRFPAEVVRDSTLKVSGLLVDEIGGPSVKPYQPAGYYRHLNFPEREYESHLDNRQWRRGVYMHWQRQYLHPMLKAFDAPSREECTAQRACSNTPLAALVLLNDPTFVESARSFAVRILTEADKSADGRIDFAFREAVSRKPNDQERAALKKLLEQSQSEFAASTGSAKQLLSIGLKPAPKDLDSRELATWTVVARAILSVNEALTRS